MPVVKDPLAGIRRPAPSHPDEHIIGVLSSVPAASWAVLTGAGLSTESGIPDYRGPGAPVRNPMTYQVFAATRAARARYWARSWSGWPDMKNARPNAGHLALARLAPGGLITQNVDGLHERAGSRDVVDLHGRLDRVVCLSCGRLYSRDAVQHALDRANPGFAARVSRVDLRPEIAPDGDVELDDTVGFDPPACPVCAGPLKPDVVFFGESVPRERTRRAEAICRAASGLVVVGSSLAVMSGLRLVRHAAKDGKPVVIVTDGPTRGDDLATYRSTARAGAFLSAWAAAGT